MDNSPFPSYETHPAYQGIAYRSQYVSMRDGVRLAVDTYLPKNLPTGERLPAVLVQSRYWRSIEAKAPVSWVFPDLSDVDPYIRKMKSFFTSHGYAIVYVDVRGTGASFGGLRYPLDPVSVQDSWDIIDWIVAQPWCNGKVAGLGISYLGLMAETLASLGHPAVKAVVPMFNQPDLFTDVAFPGGLFNQRFIREWSELDAYQDRNVVTPKLPWLSRAITRGVRPVNGSRAELAEAIAQHRDNGNAYTIAHDVTFRDEVEPEVGTCIDLVCLHSQNERMLAQNVPSMGWGSWMDAGTADAVLRRFMTYPQANHAVIGAWNHGGRMQASPYRLRNLPLDPPIDVQIRETIRFLDAHLKEISNGAAEERRITFFTLGAERWQTTTTWPPAGVRNRRWYFDEDQRLSTAPPTKGSGADHYIADRTASSGMLNRWWELSPLFNQTVDYPGRAAQAKHLLVYLTPPLESDVEICGYPVVSLQVASSLPDCAFYVYLDDVGPDGSVHYLTEGQLRAIHRKISLADSPYSIQVPYHTFKQADAMPLVPGEPAEITFGLQPLSALVRAGHCLRIGLAGFDRDTFVPIPAEGEVEWWVFHNGERASWIDLPVKE